MLRDIQLEGILCLFENEFFEHQKSMKHYFQTRELSEIDS